MPLWAVEEPRKLRYMIGGFGRRTSGLEQSNYNVSEEKEAVSLESAIHRKRTAGTGGQRKRLAGE